MNQEDLDRAIKTVCQLSGEAWTDEQEQGIETALRVLKHFRPPDLTLNEEKIRDLEQEVRRLQEELDAGEVNEN